MPSQAAAASAAARSPGRQRGAAAGGHKGVVVAAGPGSARRPRHGDGEGVPPAGPGRQLGRHVPGEGQPARLCPAVLGGGERWSLCLYPLLRAGGALRCASPRDLPALLPLSLREEEERRLLGAPLCLTERLGSPSSPRGAPAPLLGAPRWAERGPECSAAFQSCFLTSGSKAELLLLSLNRNDGERRCTHLGFGRCNSRADPPKMAC